MRMRLSAAQGSSSNTSGTTVLLPAPGGAVSTAEVCSCSPRRSCGSASSIGSPEIIRRGAPGAGSQAPNVVSEEQPAADEQGPAQGRDDPHPGRGTETQRIQAAAEKHDPAEERARCGHVVL